MFCRTCFGKKEQVQDDEVALKNSSSLTPTNSNKSHADSSREGAQNLPPSSPSRNVLEPHPHELIVPSKLNSAKVELPSPKSPNTIHPSEISPRWEPFVIERSELDQELCARMKWDISGKAVEQTIIALSKFKMMAVRAQATVAQRNAERQHTPVVNRKRRPSVAKPIDAAAAAAEPSGLAPGELDPETEEELRQSRAREDRIEEGMKLLQQRLVFLKLRAVVMEDDGNCQFRALSSELFGTQEHHPEVRGRAVDWLMQHPEDYAFYVGDEVEWAEYLQRMSTTKTWGDELTLRAACDAYGVEIHLITTEQEHWHILYQPAGPQSPTPRHVFLAYISPIHYNTVQIDSDG